MDNPQITPRDIEKLTAALLNLAASISAYTAAFASSDPSKRLLVDIVGEVRTRAQ